MCVCDCNHQLQAKLSRVQVLATDGAATSDSRDSFHDDSSDESDDDASGEKSQQVGPKSHMSLLDQHSKLKLEALGTLLIYFRIFSRSYSNHCDRLLSVSLSVCDAVHPTAKVSEQVNRK